MISTLYKPVDDASAISLERLNAVAESDLFLAGLGIRSQEYPVDSAFPVVNEISRAYYLMVSQEMWDKPQPTDEKYFVGVVEDAVNRFKNYDSEEEQRRTKSYSDNMDKFGAYMRERVATVLEDNKIKGYVLDGRIGDLSAKDVEEYVLDDLVNEIDAYFLRMILGSYLGGLESWPVANQLLKCFETGGLPCGWIGPEFEGGGNPQECMQVLHFG